jgi:hypothetical protein
MNRIEKCKNETGKNWAAIQRPSKNVMVGNEKEVPGQWLLVHWVVILTVSGGAMA